MWSTLHISNAAADTNHVVPTGHLFLKVWNVMMPQSPTFCLRTGCGQVGSCFWGNPLSTKFSQTLFFFFMFVASWRPWSCDLTYTDYNNLLMW